MGGLIVFWVVPEKDILPNCLKPLYLNEKAFHFCDFRKSMNKYIFGHAVTY